MDVSACLETEVLRRCIQRGGAIAARSVLLMVFSIDLYADRYCFLRVPRPVFLQRGCFYLAEGCVKMCGAVLSSLLP